ncbi:unnamed protein product [Rhizoctonia solani]|uniref:Uncharacterized protein n=1 Tax=Rhizoctonia solani TaxID=456999 RepID=A0A8H3DHB8_9AGAM|nr:unnamed protein product [Rhizoctonia solani]
MEYTPPIGSQPGTGEILPQYMNGLYQQQQQGQRAPQQQAQQQQQQQQQTGFGPSQQQEQLFQQGAKTIQPQAGANRMASFPPQHQAGGGPSGGMPGGMVGGPTMNGGMNMGPGVMNMPGNMGGAPGGMNPNGMPGGMGGMNPAGMNVNGPMGGMGGHPNPMNMNPMGPNTQRPGQMARKVPMPMGGMRPGMPPRMGMNVPNGMSPGLPAQGPMGGMPTLTSGMPNMGAQGMGNMGPGAGGPGGPGNTGGMGGMMQSMGGANGGMSVGAQQGGMGGPNMPGSGPGMGASSAMSGMGSIGGLNGMGGPGAPGMTNMRSNTMGNGPWLNERQYSTDGMIKRTGQLDDFNSLPGSQPPGHPLGPQPQHPHGVGGSQIGGPGHGVGGPGQMAPHPMGPQMAQQPRPPSQPTAGSPVGNLPAHHPQLSGQMGGGTPGPGPMGPGAPMQPGGTPRMATPGHPGGQLMNNPPAPSPHRMGGSPAHHQGHPHQPHIGGSPAHQNQMSSPRHMTSSSPAPGQGPNQARSNAPTPVPPRGASADPMGMRPDGMQPNDMRIPGEPSGMIRMGDSGIGNIVRGPDGSLRPANEMMVLRDGRLVRDMQPPMEGMNHAPSGDGMGRPGMGLPPNGMRPGEIGRLGPDGMVRGAGAYNAPYGAQGGNFSQPYGGIHPTPAQQHENMRRGVGGGPPGAGPGGVPRSGSVDDMSGLSSQMGLPEDLTDVIGGMSMPGRPGPGPGRASLPPQMPMNGVGPGGRGPVPMMQRRPTLMQGMQPRPIPLGMGVVRMLQMSQELTNMRDKMLSDWVRFREDFFTQSGKISMTIFYGVEGRKYMVSPEIIPRFFLCFFESGVGRISLGLNGATETTENCQNEQLESVVSTLNAVWRYELDNGWIVEHNGPVKIHLVAEPVQGDPHMYKLKIEDMTCNAPTTSYFFRPEKLDGNLIQGPSREVGPMTPRISPGLAARQTGEPVGDPNIGLTTDENGVIIEHEERLVYERASLPPKPFQTYGLPASVWRLLAMSACVHELAPVMELEQSFQMGPLAAFDQYAEMDQNARHEAGLDNMPEGMGGHSFPSFNPAFSNPPHMPDHSPALAHAQAGMHHGPHQGAALTTGRPTPTPPPHMRPGQGGPGGPIRGGMPLAGSGELPPLPGLGVGIPPGMSNIITSQSPLLSHPGAPGQPPHGQLGMKRKQQPEQGPDPTGGPSGSQPPRGVNNAVRMNKTSPALARKRAKQSTNSLS